MLYYSRLCSIFIFWLIPLHKNLFLLLRIIWASIEVTALKSKKTPFLIDSTGNMVHVIFFLVCAEFPFLTYSFTQILLLIDKNNLGKFHSHSSKIEEMNAISNKQLPQHGACYIILVCAQFSFFDLFIFTYIYFSF